MSFQIGDIVDKVGGGYQARGTVRAVFTTNAGVERVVFEFHSHPGMLHIFAPHQLELAEVH